MILGTVLEQIYLWTFHPFCCMYLYMLRIATKQHQCRNFQIELGA